MAAGSFLVHKEEFRSIMDASGDPKRGEEHFTQQAGIGCEGGGIDTRVSSH